MKEETERFRHLLLLVDGRSIVLACNLLNVLRLAVVVKEDGH